jgi:hypothetical protein
MILNSSSTAPSGHLNEGDRTRPPQSRHEDGNDRKRLAAASWLNPSRHNPKWRARARVAAAMFHHKWVRDIGSGREHLSAYLPLDSIYLPADLYEWHDGVERCDLNVGELPPSDIAVLLGVEQLLHDLGNTLKQLAEHAEFILISQHPKETNPERDALTVGQFGGLLNAAGYTIIGTKVYKRRQVIYYGWNENFASSRMRAREAARRGHRPPTSKDKAWRLAQRFIPMLHGWQMNPRQSPHRTENDRRQSNASLRLRGDGGLQN